jgi:hypothetical protein
VCVCVCVCFDDGYSQGASLKCFLAFTYAVTVTVTVSFIQTTNRNQKTCTTKPRPSSSSSAQASTGFYADSGQLHAFWQRGTRLLQVLQANAQGTKQQHLVLGTVYFNACVCLRGSQRLECFFLDTCNLIYLLGASSLTERKDHGCCVSLHVFPCTCPVEMKLWILCDPCSSLAQFNQNKKSHSQQYSPEGFPVAPCS